MQVEFVWNEKSRFWYLGSSETGSNVKRYFDLNKLSRWGISNNDGGPNGHAIPNNANERWSSIVCEGFCPYKIPIRPSISNVYRKKKFFFSKFFFSYSYHKTWCIIK